MHVYAMFASSTKECLRMFTQLTTHLPMVYACLLKISSHALSLHAAGQIQKQELQRLLLAGGNWNEYTSSLSVHVDSTMIHVHSEAVLNVQLVPGGWRPVNRFALLFRASVTNNDEEAVLWCHAASASSTIVWVPRTCKWVRHNVYKLTCLRLFALFWQRTERSFIFPFQKSKSPK